MQNDPWRADFVLTLEMAKLSIESEFPALAPCDVVTFAEGWDNFVILVNRDWVFRFPRRKIAVELLRQELQVLPQIASRLPTQVPYPEYIGRHHQSEFELFVGYKRLPGQPVHLMDIGLSERCTAVRQLARFLKVLHSVPRMEGEAWGVQDDTIGRMDVIKRKKSFWTYLDTAKQRGLITDLMPYAQVLDNLSERMTDSASVALVHGDLNFRNFLLSPSGELSAVIDWGDVHLGHPAVDISVAFSLVPQSHRTVFIEEYGEVNDTTWELARFRALYTNLIILVSAHDLGRSNEVREARRALVYTLG